MSLNCIGAILDLFTNKVKFMGARFATCNKVILFKCTASDNCIICIYVNDWNPFCTHKLLIVHTLGKPQTIFQKLLWTTFDRVKSINTYLKFGWQYIFVSIGLYIHMKTKVKQRSKQRKKQNLIIPQSDDIWKYWTIHSCTLW